MTKRSASPSESDDQSRSAKKNRLPDGESALNTPPVTNQHEEDEVNAPVLPSMEIEETLPNTLKINHIIGNIFEAPPGSVLIHSCNCLGIWGKGIAEAFRKEYPAAFKVYKSHCNKAKEPADLRGTALLIPPSGGPVEKSKDHFIGCLFTSVNHGSRKCKPPRILEATQTSMVQLLDQIAEIPKQRDIIEVRMPQINSGLFAVPWKDTEKVMQSLTCPNGIPLPVHVFERK